MCFSKTMDKLSNLEGCVEFGRLGDSIAASNAFRVKTSEYKQINMDHISPPSPKRLCFSDEENKVCGKKWRIFSLFIRYMFYQWLTSSKNIRSSCDKCLLVSWKYIMCSLQENHFQSPVLLRSASVSSDLDATVQSIIDKMETGLEVRSFFQSSLLVICQIQKFEIVWVRLIMQAPFSIGKFFLWKYNDY